MRWEDFFKHNWKKILIVLVILAVWYFFGSSGLYISGIGFNSGGAIVGGYKKCSCLGIPNNDLRMGGSRFYCIGIPIDCHCYLENGYPGIEKSEEVGCDCPEGKYYIDFPAGRTDYCNLFRSW